MTPQPEKAERFLAQHRPGAPLLMPNAWDVGSAKLLESLGFDAIATTSSGFAATLGRVDNSVTREEALAHSAAIVAATPLPVSADLENGFADDAEGVAETVRAALDAGLAGCSIEDSTGREDQPLYAPEQAAERMTAAADAAGGRLVLTGRAENFIVGRGDIADTIARLQAYQEAGADVLYAPGLARIEDIRSVVESVDRPVNVLARTGLPPVSELAAAGVSRISVGGSFAFAALDALVRAATELRDRGTYGYIDAARSGATAAAVAFADDS
jgi:2-methylisocitrate lyase-like PEP mutase family enzyme